LSLLDLLADLEKALLAETDALRARDVAALNRAVDGKRQALAALGRLGTAGRDGDEGGAEALLLLGRCRELNDIAGSAIAVLRQDTDNALGLLGVDSPPPGYGASGRGFRNGRDLAVC
jgi:hypothetical protein